MAQALLRRRPTLFLNAKLIDGEGRRARRGRRRPRRGQHGSPQVGSTADWGENPNGNQRVIDLKGKTLHAGPHRGPLPHLVLGRPRASGPRPQAARRALDDLRGQERRARAALRLHVGRQRRRAAPRRRDDPRRDRPGHHPGPAHGRLRAATSARRAGMLDWNPSFWKLGMEGLAIFADGVDEVRKAVRQNIQEGARRHQAVRHRRGPARGAGHPARGDDVLPRGDPGRRARGAHTQPPGRGARARQRRRQALRRGRAST